MPSEPRSLRFKSGRSLAVINADRPRPHIRPGLDVVANLGNRVGDASEYGLNVALEIANCVGPRPAQGIADVAREVEVDVIVVGGRGHSPIGGVLLGSVTRRLPHIAPLPALLGLPLVVVSPIALGLGLHPRKPRVVIGKLVQMRSCDLAGRDFVVVADVRRRVSPPVLELDLQRHAELLNIEARRLPIDPYPLANGLRLLGREARGFRHHPSVAHTVQR